METYKLQLTTAVVKINARQVGRLTVDVSDLTTKAKMLDILDSNIKEIDYWKEEIKAAIDELSEAHDAAEAMEKRISTARDHYLEIDGVTRRCFEKR